MRVQSLAGHSPSLYNFILNHGWVPDTQFYLLGFETKQTKEQSVADPLRGRSLPLLTAKETLWQPKKKCKKLN